MRRLGGPRLCTDTVAFARVYPGSPTAGAWGAITGGWQAGWDSGGAGPGWVNATTVTVAAGESFVRGFRLILAAGVMQKEAALLAAGKPVVSAVPGYVIAADMEDAALLIHPPAGQSIASVASMNDDGTSPPCFGVGAVAPAPVEGWKKVQILGNPSPAKTHCRCRVEVTYSDGTYQAASFFMLPPLHTHMSTFSTFQRTTAFYTDDTDPFGRAPAFMPWDRKKKQHVLHDSRNFVVGLSDEAGAGANVGYSIKQRFAPVQSEIEALDLYINSTLWGIHCPAAPLEYQKNCSLQDHWTHGIKASLFWTNASATWDHPSGMPGCKRSCDTHGPARPVAAVPNQLWVQFLTLRLNPMPSAFIYFSLFLHFVMVTVDKYQPEDFAGWKWDRRRAYSLFRAYNYPHQTVCYWSMYRAVRDNPGITASQPALWYLSHAIETINGAWSRWGGLWYMQQGLMAGSVWLDVLQDARLEGLDTEADRIEEIMGNRTLPGKGIVFYSSAVCPKPSNSPFQACVCANCTKGSAANPCAEANYTTGVVYHCKAWADNPLPYGIPLSLSFSPALPPFVCLSIGRGWFGGFPPPAASPSPFIAVGARTRTQLRYELHLCFVRCSLLARR